MAIRLMEEVIGDLLTEGHNAGQTPMKPRDIYRTRPYGRSRTAANWSHWLENAWNRRGWSKTPEPMRHRHGGPRISTRLRSQVPPGMYGTVRYSDVAYAL